MTHIPVSVTIITLNEESNLPRALKSVTWADEIIVVDSGSTDRTREIAAQAGAKVIENPWPGFGAQKNFAQDQAKNDWILNIDADEEVPEDLAEEIQTQLGSKVKNNGIHGFIFPRKTYYLGRWIKHGGWYPNYLTRLAHRNHARWTEPHLHEHLEVKGITNKVNIPLNHYTFTGIQDQILTNLKFSALGSKDLTRKGIGPSILKMLLKPLWKFIHTYFFRLGMMDGLPGFIISINAAHSMFLKYAYLIETKINESSNR